MVFDMMNTKQIYYKKIQTNNNGRDIIIGDLHGNLKALMFILNEIKFDYSNDRILSTGDLVDRGDNSLDCLRLTKEVFFESARGNHEEFLHSFFLALKEFLITTNNYGSKNALKFISSNGESLRSMSSEWIYDLASENKLSMSLIDEIILLSDKREISHIMVANDGDRELIFTHSSLPSSLPRELNSSDSLIEKSSLSGRKADVFLTEVLWSVNKNFVLCHQNRKELKNNLSSLYENKQPLIFHGHTVFDNVMKVNQEIFLDTGCGFKSNRKNNPPRLSAIVLQEKRLLESNEDGLLSQYW